MRRVHIKPQKNVATLLANGASALAKDEKGRTPKQAANHFKANDDLIGQLEAAEKV